ncbi:alginate lyase, partial [Xanthomonas sp. Kuri4-1]
QLRDGADGRQGALAILRAGAADGQTLVMKNTKQGMGHGHFDKLNWLFYDNGQRVVGDYGAARFLNVEAKSGGIYLPENASWARQTVAHNTLVVDERSHFDGDWKRGEALAPQALQFVGEGDTRLASARMAQAYPGVVFTRTLALLSHPDLPLPVAVDLLQVRGDKPARYDLPLHFNGQIMTVGFDTEPHLAERPVLGRANGYQHLWVDADSAPSAAPRTLSWLLDGRFYTYRFGSSAPSRALIVESGAHDPAFNLRREPALIQRIDGQARAAFFSVLEPHGRYDGTAETVKGADSRIRAIEHFRGDGADVVRLTLVNGKRVALAIAEDPAATAPHRVDGGGQQWQWSGGWKRFDAEPAR